jgi:adenylate cyclase
MVERRPARATYYPALAPARPSRVSLDARLDRFSGRFVDRAIEAEFAKDSAGPTRRFLRVSIVLSGVVFLAYGVHDALVVPAEARNTAWAIRYAVFPPAIALALLAVRSTDVMRWHQSVMLLYGMAASLVVMTIGAISAPAPAFYIYTSYALVFMTLGPLIAKMNVTTQIAYTLLSIAAYNVLDTLIAQSSGAILFSFNTSMLALGGIGALTARLIEQQARQSFLQRRLIAEQVELLDEEKGKTDALLLNILPSRIAERLKHGDEAVADAFGDVTVLFADIVGFTALAERLAASDLVERLNEIFSAFDDLADEHGLEKIKTIGDSYMAVGGLPVASADHTQAVADMALGMQRAIAEISEASGENLRLRIGIHTGPVVAGVIGKRKFAYDVWGDTVNTASRMESRALDGTIQVSEPVYERLKDAFVLESRGPIEVKGKGSMPAWSLKARR